ncbi:MAG: aminopeptidase [Verrucomicrobiota bacterium]|jgi:aminopeptidase N
MKDAAPKAIFLKDYQAPAFACPSLELLVQIFDSHTRVTNTAKYVRNPGSKGALVLSGEKMKLISVSLDGAALNPTQYEVSDEALVIPTDKNEFSLVTVVDIEPQNNTSLEGLYQSGSIFCTQNEPEGFRKITYHLDRSDVMSSYVTRIEADKVKYPYLLSNGNRIAAGELGAGRHFATWQDPFKKPSYLFALVAGDFDLVSDSFTTCSGRKVALEIYVDRGNADRAPHALESLKLAMKWDEERFGLEYDLDIYMIVAVDAFNMGAMENKGLNIFNTSAALANAKTATDANYQSIEAIVAHEYFHNWTGNRVTCRDWFQLTLKEGLTVYRDQEFSADHQSRPVMRIQEVAVLRNSQFVEDAGPNAHPIKPVSYIEINNFYTSTVYRKGAEVIRMIETLIGKPAFRKGMDKYFELFDGQAVTTEDFVKSMELASGRDLTHFKLWYAQAGTPRLKVQGCYDPAAKTYTLEVEQSIPETPDVNGKDKKPMHMPLVVGLVGADGRDLALTLDGKTKGICSKSGCASQVLELTQAKQSFTFTGVNEKPIPSLNRDFRAPVILDFAYTKAELAFLFAHDADPFNRYEAGQRLANLELDRLIAEFKAGKKPAVDPAVIEAFRRLFLDARLDNAFKAECLGLPTITLLIERMPVIDVDAAFAAREALRDALAIGLKNELLGAYAVLGAKGAYSVDGDSIGRRSLRNTVLSYLVLLGHDELIALAKAQFDAADNMTDEIAALGVLCQVESKATEEALAAFHAKWKHDPLVMNKYFAVQAASRIPAVLGRIPVLAQDVAFDAKNPNKIRSLWGQFGANLKNFHRADGAGYALIAEQIIRLSPINGAVAAGLAGAFKKYAKLDPSRKALMKTQLERILALDGLAKDVFEIVSKTLKQGE